MTPDEKAAPGRTRGRQEVESHRHLATIDRPTQRRVSVAGHQVARRAIRAACIAVGLFPGPRPEELAAEVARRAVASLRSKGGRP